MKAKILIICIAALLLFTGFACAEDTIPSLPAEFYGNATTISGTPLPAGLILSATVNNETFTFPITETGKIGGSGTFDGKLIVAPSNPAGNTITFSINGIKAYENETFVSGKLTDISLTFPNSVLPANPPVISAGTSPSDIISPYGGSGDTGSGNYNQYPRTATDGGAIDFGTSKVVKGVQLPEGVNGQVVLDVSTTEPGPAGKEVSTVFDISVTNYPEGKETVIVFELTNAELTNKGWKSQDVVLYHKENNAWVKLPTYYTVSGSKTVYNAVTKSFSPFAIVFEEGGAEKINEENLQIFAPGQTQQTNVPASPAATAADSGKDSGSFPVVLVIVIVIAAGIIIGLVVYIINLKKKTGGPKKKKYDEI